MFIRSLFVFLFLTVNAFTAVHDPAALKKVIEQVREHALYGERPVVLFDLDDTLINTRERTLRVIRDFSSLTDTRNAFPVEASKVAELKFNQVHYNLADTLQEVGISSKDFVDKATAFWVENFFSNKYAQNDVPNPGAVNYLHLLVKAGAKIVYLTGRDVPRMQEGTILDLQKNNFPKGTLLMKPNKDINDLEFKKSQFATVADLGVVVGIFENEPVNINTMVEAFPEAEPVFLDTIHSPLPDVPVSRVDWVSNFLLQ